MPPIVRVWRCPRCGRTRPGATSDARNPVCRYDLAEMQLSRGGRPDSQGFAGRRNGDHNVPPSAGGKPAGFKKRRRKKSFPGNNQQP